MKKLIVLLLVVWLGIFFSCEKESEGIVNDDLVADLLRIEAYLRIDDVDFVKSNGQVTLDIKDQLYMVFDTRDGDMSINESTGEINTSIDYVGVLGAIHKGSISARLVENGGLSYLDYAAEMRDTAGTVITHYEFQVTSVPESSNVIIDDITKTREITFELSGTEVCRFLTDDTKDPPVFNASYHFESQPLTEYMSNCDCSGESSLSIVFVYREP
jgi:hypothetical protein